MKTAMKAMKAMKDMKAMKVKKKSVLIGEVNTGKTLKDAWKTVVKKNSVLLVKGKDKANGKPKAKAKAKAKGKPKAGGGALKRPAAASMGAGMASETMHERVAKKHGLEDVEIGQYDRRKFHEMMTTALKQRKQGKHGEVPEDR